MTVVVSKGLISRTNIAPLAPTPAQPPIVPQGSEALRLTASAVASVAVASDAVVNSVRAAARSERADSRVRNPKDAENLARELSEKIRGEDEYQAEGAHYGLDPLGASGHLR